ncbi:MAG: CBS domain-containing protein [Phycisphaerales bacterium]
MHTLIVEDIMSHPVETVSMDHSVDTIKKIFESSNYHHLIVAGEQGRCMGVISDRDLLKNISPFLNKPGERTADIACLQRRAHQIMSRQLVAVRRNTSLRAAARVMLDHRISCLPVVDAQKKCIGIITVRDIVAWAVLALEMHVDEPLDDLPDIGGEPRSAA